MRSQRCANALARLTPASGPQPRIPSGFGGCVGGFWGGFAAAAAAAQRPPRGRKPPEFPDLLLKLEKRARGTTCALLGRQMYFGLQSGGKGPHRVWNDFSHLGRADRAQTRRVTSQKPPKTAPKRAVFGLFSAQSFNLAPSPLTRVPTPPRPPPRHPAPGKTQRR